MNNTIPSQQGNVCESHFSREKSIVISTEIEKLLEKQVLEKVESEDGEFISPIFLRPKKNGSYRMILNLKEFNQNVEYHHFKMETFEKALTNDFSGQFLGIHGYQRCLLLCANTCGWPQIPSLPMGKGNCFSSLASQMGFPVGQESTQRWWSRFTLSYDLRVIQFRDTLMIPLIVADSEAELQQSIKESLHTFETLGFHY